MSPCVFRIPFERIQHFFGLQNPSGTLIDVLFKQNDACHYLLTVSLAKARGIKRKLSYVIFVYGISLASMCIHLL